MKPIKRFPSGFRQHMCLNAAFLRLMRNCWSIQTGFVSTKTCSTTWCESRLWTRSAYRCSSQISWIVVHLTEHVKKQYGKKFAMKGCYLSVNCSTSAFLIVWQNSVRYEFHKPQTFYENFLVQWNLLQSHIFSWKPVWVPEGLPMTWSVQGPICEGRVKSVHIPDFPVFWEKQMLYHMDHSRFWKHHLSAFHVYNSIPSWIVIKTWSRDALPLLGYEAEEHQLFATNPLNSLDKFHGQFLTFETVVTSAKVFICREWKAVTSYEQSNLLGNGGWLIWGMALGSRPYYNQVLNLDPSG